MEPAWSQARAMSASPAATTAALPEEEPQPEIVAKDALTYVTEQFVVATDERDGQLDWVLVEEVVERADGMPATVGESIKNAAASAASE